MRRRKYFFCGGLRRISWGMVCIMGERISNLGLTKRYEIRRYKIRRYKIQDIETEAAVSFFCISCIFVSCNLYLTEKLQFTNKKG